MLLEELRGPPIVVSCLSLFSVVYCCLSLFVVAYYFGVVLFIVVCSRLLSLFVIVYLNGIRIEAFPTIVFFTRSIEGLFIVSVVTVVGLFLFLCL